MLQLSLISFNVNVLVIKTVLQHFFSSFVKNDLWGDYMKKRDFLTILHNRYYILHELMYTKDFAKQWK